jgi:muramoyltetrapeptide carboxypeptidase
VAKSSNFKNGNINSIVKMNRKNFLSSVLALGGAMPTLVAANNAGIHDHNPFPGQPRSPLPIIPAYLQAGDMIGITCPAGAITLKEIQPSIDLIESWGFRIKIGDTVGKKEFTFGGTDEERAKDLQQMMDDPSLKAILCARGGYGSVHIVDRLDFKGLSAHPKWIIGFSDITVIHCHLHRHLNMASIHSKMCNSFPDDWIKAEPVQIDTILSIRQALSGGRICYRINPSDKNRAGLAEGPLVGGNLKTIETLAGTASDLPTDGKILFVEDTGEYLYSIDRMFWNLERTGKLAGLKGLIIGGFKIRPDDPGEDFGHTLYDIVLERAGRYVYPVCFDFPVGHQKDNYALKYGIVHRLEIAPGISTLEESSGG